MKIYLVNRAATDEKVDKKNPPLSEEGIRRIKALRLKLPTIKIDYCFTSPLVCDYATAMILVGDKVLIDRDKRLQKKSTASVEKQITDFLKYVESLDQNKNILIVADKDIVKKLKSQTKEATILNEKAID